MLFGISVLFGNSMDRCTGISVSVVQGFIRCDAVQGFSNGLVCHRLAVNEGKLIFHLPGPRASNDSRWRSSFDSTSMFRK